MEARGSIDNMIKASIIIATHNMGNSIEKLIISVLSQSEGNFELIIIDDGSTDDTKKIINNIKDKRLKYIQNVKKRGKSFSRNKGIALSKSNNLFFTDADCAVTKNWIEEGLKSLGKGFDGIEGKVYYVSKNYKPTRSDRVVRNLYGGEYMTANIAYKKNVLIKLGLFNVKFKRNQDRDLALRVKMIGKIIFNPNMIVYHTASKWTASTYMHSASWVYYRVILFFKIYNESYNMVLRVYAPEKLLSIIFPPIILIKLLIDKHKTKNDYMLFFLTYPKLVYERLLLWKYSIKEKVLII